MRRSSMFMVGVVGALANSALGHVFWLQPSSFSPAKGDIVKLQLRVGDAFPGDVLPRNEARIVRFQAAQVGAHEPEPVTGRDGRDPAGLVRLKEEGTCVIAYESNFAAVTLPSDKFEAYLHEKGLEKIIEQRKAKGESKADGREEYARCAKAIVDVGGKSSAGFDQVVGMRYEIVPLRDPSQITPGTGDAATLRVRCLFDGKPVTNAMVEARSPDSSNKIVTRTSETGEATLVIPAGGIWVVDSVEMIEAPDVTARTANMPQWQSFWASLTFSCGNAQASK